MRIFDFLVIGVLTTACGTITELIHSEPIEETDFDVEILNLVDERRFEVRLISKSDRQICISFGDWPASEDQARGSGTVRLGSMNFASEVVYVLTLPGTRIPLRQSNHGTCIASLEDTFGCATKIPPGHSLVGSIPYQEFTSDVANLPEGQYSLVFSVAPFFCPD